VCPRRGGRNGECRRAPRAAQVRPSQAQRPRTPPSVRSRSVFPMRTWLTFAAASRRPPRPPRGWCATRPSGARWPSRELGADRSQGVQLATLQELARYWANDYDLRRVEARLNALPQFTTEI